MQTGERAESGKKMRTGERTGGGGGGGEKWNEKSVKNEETKGKETWCEERGVIG